jgi:hypothetical protein
VAAEEPRQGDRGDAAPPRREGKDHGLRARDSEGPTDARMDPAPGPPARGAARVRAAASGPRRAPVAVRSGAVGSAAGQASARLRPGPRDLQARPETHLRLLLPARARRRASRSPP